jgi:NitT/TauT family transport system ATP-binding protein
MIKFTAVSKSFGDQEVLRDLSFDIRSGECVSLIGPSGVGKTTVLRLITGAIAPDRGKVQVTESKVGYIYQEPRLLPWRTTLDNIALGLRVEGGDKKRARSAAQQWVARLGLNGFAQHYPSQLSGGMQQRVAIGRALAIEPELLILDEPFSHLDAELKDALLSMMEGLIKEYQPTVIHVTHDLIEALRLAERVFKLSNGSLLDELDLEERGAILRDYVFRQGFSQASAQSAKQEEWRR